MTATLTSAVHKLWQRLDALAPKRSCKAAGPPCPSPRLSLPPDRPEFVHFEARPAGLTYPQLVRSGELTPCRPGGAYLMRRSGLGERAVEYHLQMLREAGLLVWESRGTRVRGERARASVYVRVVPPEFDAALGIRTVLREEGAPASSRAASGIAEAGRKLMARLGRKAARRVRRPRPRSRPGSSPTAKPSRQPSGTAPGRTPVTAVSGGSDGGTRCTPMRGSSSAVSTAGTTSLPPETQLASGADTSSTPASTTTAPSRGRGLNRVGRRYQLARELIESIGWLQDCSVPRIAWVCRSVADAGWTVTQVRGWLHVRGHTTRTVRRGSGLLAVLLHNAAEALDTPGKREYAVEQWRAAQEAERRHRIEQVRARAEQHSRACRPPVSRAVQRELETAIAEVRALDNAGRHTGEVLDAGAVKNREAASRGYHAALAAHRSVASSPPEAPDIAAAWQRQTQALRRLGLQAFPEANTLPGSTPPPFDRARAQHRRNAATQAAALHRARAERAARAGTTATASSTAPGQPE